MRGIFGSLMQTIVVDDLESKILRFISKATSVLWEDSVLVETISSNAELLDALHAEIQGYNADLHKISRIQARYQGVAQLVCELFHAMSAMAPAQPAFHIPLALYLGLLKQALRERGIGAGEPHANNLPSRLWRIPLNTALFNNICPHAHSVCVMCARPL
jgi:hypothetical protein